MGLGFAALGRLPLPEVTAIGYAAPLLVVVFAAVLLGERVRAFRLSAVALGLAGVLVVLAPRLTVAPGSGTAAQGLGAALVLGGAVFSAFAQIVVRRLVATERTAAIVFYFSLTATLLSLATAPFGWVVPAPREAALLVMCGLLGGVGQILLTSSYREGRRVAGGALRLRLDPVRARHRLLGVRRGADGHDARGRHAGHSGRGRDHRARASPGAGADAAAPGDDAAGLTRRLQGRSGALTRPRRSPT